MFWSLFWFAAALVLVAALLWAAREKIADGALWVWRSVCRLWDKIWAEHRGLVWLVIATAFAAWLVLG